MSFDKWAASWLLPGLAAMAIETMFFSHLFDNNWWIVILSVALAAAPAILASTYSSRKGLALVLALLAAGCTTLMYPLYAMQFSYIPPRDPIYHLQVVDLLMESGSIPFGLGVYQAWAYSYYPFFHLVVAAFSMATGIGTSTSLTLFSLLSTLFPLAIYLFARRIFKSERIALIAAIMYVYVPGSYPGTGYRHISLIFFYLFLVCFFSYQDTKKRVYIALSLIFLFALSATHHMTLYLTLGLVVATYTITSISSSKLSAYRIPITSLILLLGAALIWPTYVAYDLSAGHVAQFSYLYFSGAHVPYELMTFSPAYSVPENVFILLSISCVLAISAIGFTVYIMGHGYDRRFLAFSAFFGALFLFGFATRTVHETAAAIWWRFWEPFFAAAAPSFAYFLSTYGGNNVRKEKRGTGRILGSLGLVVMMCLAVSYALLVPREYMDFEFERERGAIVSMREGGSQVYQATIWFSKHVDRTSMSVCDQPTYDFIKGYFRSNAVYDWNIYVNKSALGTDIAILRNKGVRYIFVDQLLSMYDQSPTYLRYVGKVPRENLVFLGAVLPRIYDNSLVQVCTIDT